MRLLFQLLQFNVLALVWLAASIVPANADEVATKDPLSIWNDVPEGTETENGLAPLTDRDRKLILESFLRPYHSGHWDTVVDNARSRLSNRSLEEVETISEHLDAAEQPTLEEMITRSRVQLLRSGMKQLPEATPVESVLLQKQLARMIEEKFELLRGIDLMKSPLENARDFSVYRDLIWDRHVQSNEFLNAAQLAQQGLAIQNAASVKNELPSGAAEYNFKKYLTELEELRRELDERALEVRVNRVRYAAEILADESAGVKDRFLSAYVLGVDSETLIDDIKRGQPRFERPALKESKLLDQLSANLETGSKSAGDLIEKSRMLFSGLHWWRRGRYGMGTEAFGLMKSRQALRNPILQIALRMPKVTPVPNDPMVFTRNPSPHFQRRHMYFWAYEDRVFGSRSRTEEYNLGTSTTSSLGPLVNKHFDGLIDGTFW